MKRIAVIMVLTLLMGSIGISGLANEKLVDMEFRDAPLVDVFQVLGEIGGLNVLVDPSVSGTVSFYLRELEVLEALDLVARTTGYRYQIVGNTLVVASEERLRREFSVEEFSFLTLNHVDVLSARQLIQLVVPNVKLYVDASKNLVVAYGARADLALASQLIERYDQEGAVSADTTSTAADEKPAQEVRREFSFGVRFGNGSQIVTSLRDIFPVHDFQWDRDAEVIRVQAPEDEWPAIQGAAKELDLPSFVLKGIVDSGNRKIALVEFGQTVSRLGEADVFFEWTVESISNKEVQFRQGERTFTIWMGR